MDSHEREYDAAVAGMHDTYGKPKGLTITPDMNRARGPDRVLLYRQGKVRSRAVILHAVGTDGTPGRRAWRIFDALEITKLGPVAVTQDGPLPLCVGPLEKILELAAAWCRRGRWAALLLFSVVASGVVAFVAASVVLVAVWVKHS